MITGAFFVEHWFEIIFGLISAGLLAYFRNLDKKFQQYKEAFEKLNENKLDETKTIYIDKNLNNSYLQKVLCHEITHAAMFSYDINLSLEQEKLLADLLATYGQEVVQKANILFKRIKENRGSY